MTRTNQDLDTPIVIWKIHT